MHLIRISDFLLDQKSPDLAGLKLLVTYMKPSLSTIRTGLNQLYETITKHY